MRAWLIVAALALPPTLSQAQGAAASAPVAGVSSPAKKEIAQKVVKAQQASIEQLAASLVEQPAAVLLQQAAAALQNAPAEKREAMSGQLRADAKKYVDDATPLIKTRAWALAQDVLPSMFEARFSEDELKQILAWLESPVSKKFGQATPEMGKALTEKLVADMRPTIDPKVKALQATMAKTLGLPPAGASAPASAPARAKSPAPAASKP